VTAKSSGTFIFVFFIGLSKNAAALQPLVPAFALLIMKYALGHVSLASLNPANSVGLFLRGVLRVKSLVAYIGAELLGGALGAAMASAFVTDKNQAVILSIKSSIGIGFLAEMLGTFILVFVSLNNTSQVKLTLKFVLLG
jgi:aquaporin Z